MAARGVDKELVDRLGTVPLFNRTTKKQRRVLASLGKTISWKAGTVGLKQGSRGAAFFLVLEGNVEVSRDGKSVARLSDGDHVGEIALLENSPRNADVTAITDTKVFAFSRTALVAALHTDPQMAMALLQAMASRRSATM